MQDRLKLAMDDVGRLWDLWTAAEAARRTLPPIALGGAPAIDWLDRINREIDQVCHDSDGLMHPVVTDAAVRDALLRIGGLALVGIAEIDRQGGRDG